MTTLNPNLRLRPAARLIVLDPEGRALMFRYDVPGRDPFWVTAGGEVEPGETFEDAARRELLEETGCEAARWRTLGSVAPNPAVHDNLCHMYLAEGVERVQEPSLDEGEDLETLWMTAEEVRAAVADGTIHSALAVAALARVLDLRVAAPEPAD